MDRSADWQEWRWSIENLTLNRTPRCSSQLDSQIEDQISKNPSQRVLSVTCKTDIQTFLSL